jgi:hypothetical protein
MKSGRAGFCVLLLGMLFLLSCPVHADEMWLTVTDVFFTKDGHPYNDSVKFTMNCYGWSRYLDRALYPGKGNYTPELVFSFPASCPGYDCRIYENYYHADWNIIEYCNLEGVTKGKNFSILNFSRTPTPRCQWLRQFDFYDDGEYYRYTPEYSQCKNESYAALDAAVKPCEKYLVPCRSYKECRKNLRVMFWAVGTVGNSTWVQSTPAYEACRDEAREDVRRKTGPCEGYVERVDPATIDMFFDGSRVLGAQRACTLRFALPSGSGTTPADSPSPLSPGIQKVPGLHMPMMSNPGAVPAAARQSPVESLFCSILQNLGGTCE